MFPLIQAGFQLASSLGRGRPLSHFSVLLSTVSVGVLGTAIGSKIDNGGDGLTRNRTNT